MSTNAAQKGKHSSPGEGHIYAKANEVIVKIVGIDSVFDAPEHLARYLAQQRANGAKLIRESGFKPR
jgi:hypothetical protein